MTCFLDTLGNPDWMRDNQYKLLDLLPADWTDVKDVNFLQLGYGFKLLGIPWSSNEEFAKIFVYLERTQLMLRDDFKIKRGVPLREDVS